MNINRRNLPIEPRKISASDVQFLATSGGMAAANPRDEEGKDFGLNSAKVHGVDVKAKMGAIPTDYVTKGKQNIAPKIIGSQKLNMAG